MHQIAFLNYYAVDNNMFSNYTACEIYTNIVLQKAS